MMTLESLREVKIVWEMNIVMIQENYYVLRDFKWNEQTQEL